ncbi:MAG: hypothetical protein AAFX93_19415 [Verrucomicrobiota bacterium]
MPTTKKRTARSRAANTATSQEPARIYKYTSRVPVRHDLSVSLNDNTEKLTFFLVEAHNELGHPPSNPLDPDTVALSDAANAVRDELYRRLGGGTSES